MFPCTPLRCAATANPLGLAEGMNDDGAVLTVVVGFYSLTKCPPKRANPWVLDLCKHPLVLPYPAPHKVKIHQMAPSEQQPP